MAKLTDVVRKQISRFAVLLSLPIVLSACDLDSDSVYYKVNDYVQHYAQLTKDFYVNNGFDERSARAMAVLHNALYKTRYDKQLADDSDLVERFHDITFREAKNIFACSILDGRALQAVNHKDEIKEQVDNYMNLLYESRRISTEVIDKGGTQSEADKIFKEKYGSIIDKLTIERFFIITGFDKTYEACAYKNIKQNYLSRPEAQQID